MLVLTSQCYIVGNLELLESLHHFIVLDRLLKDLLHLRDQLVHVGILLVLGDIGHQNLFSNLHDFADL